MSIGERVLGRRRALGWLIGATLAVVAAACAGPVPASTPVGRVEIGCTSDALARPGGETYTYEGTAGEGLNVLFTSDERGGRLAVLDPSGVELRPDGRDAGPHYRLPATGRYRVVQSGLPIGSAYRLCVSDDEPRGRIDLGTRTITGIPGQRILLTYAGTAGELLNVDGGQVVTDDGGAHAAAIPQQWSLDDTGDRVIRAGLGGDGSASLTLSHDATGGAIGLGRTDVPSLLPGQHIRYAFSTTPGVWLDVCTDDTRLTIVDPFGTVWRSKVWFTSTDPWQFVVDPGTADRHSFYVRTDPPPEPIGLGTTVVGEGEACGATHTLVYTGVAGQRLRITPFSGRFITAPDGRQITPDPTTPGATFTLPVDGGYTFQVGTGATGVPVLLELV